MQICTCRFSLNLILVHVDAQVYTFIIIGPENIAACIDKLQVQVEFLPGYGRYMHLGIIIQISSPSHSIICIVQPHPDVVYLVASCHVDILPDGGERFCFQEELYAWGFVFVCLIVVQHSLEVHAVQAGTVYGVDVFIGPISLFGCPVGQFEVAVLKHHVQIGLVAVHVPVRAVVIE